MEKDRSINNYENSYIGDYGFEKYQVRYRRKKVLEEISRFDPHCVLEIGCGLTPLFCYDEKRDYVVVEPSKAFYDAASAESAGKENRVRVYNAFFKGSELDLLNESKMVKLEQRFDMIICSSLLHEVPDPAGLLAGIKEVCEKDTMVHVNVPNKNSVHRLLAYESGLIKDKGEFSKRNIELQQNSVYDLNELITLVKSQGFKVVDKGSYFIKPFSHRQMQDCIEAGIISEQILDGLYNLVSYVPDLGSELFVNCFID